jgi:putative FmdB family regulatory protein
MPTYSYRCSSCQHEFDELKPVAERKTHDCPLCGAVGNQRITPVRIDYYNMGLDPAFPTAYDRWGKTQTEKARIETKRHGE